MIGYIVVVSGVIERGSVGVTVFGVDILSGLVAIVFGGRGFLKEMGEEEFS